MGLQGHQMIIVPECREEMPARSRDLAEPMLACRKQSPYSWLADIQIMTLTGPQRLYSSFHMLLSSKAVKGSSSQQADQDYTISTPEVTWQSTSFLKPIIGVCKSSLSEALGQVIWLPSWHLKLSIVTAFSTTWYGSYSCTKSCACHEINEVWQQSLNLCLWWGNSIEDFSWSPSALLRYQQLQNPQNLTYLQTFWVGCGKPCSLSQISTCYQCFISWVSVKRTWAKSQSHLKQGRILIIRHKTLDLAPSTANKQQKWSRMDLLLNRSTINYKCINGLLRELFLCGL